jgi:Abnormal spindle-like microcephaly-assoc'd, ASPM-SPD-2-Hydin
VLPGNSASLPVVVRNPSAAELTITCLSSTDETFSASTAVPFTIPAGDSASIDITFSPQDQADHLGTFYVRSVSDTELVACPVTVSGTSLNPASVPGGGDLAFRLEAPQPTPFTGSTLIRFQLPRAQRVRLEVFDVNGRRVRTLVNGERSAGVHEVVWKPGVRASGLYFCRLWAGPKSLTQKVVLAN